MLRELIDPEYFEALAAATEEPGQAPEPSYGVQDPLAGLVLEDVEPRQGPYHHRLLDYLRRDILPTTFCVGCGGGTLLSPFCL